MDRPLSVVKSEAEAEGEMPLRAMEGGASDSNRSNRSVEPRGLRAVKRGKRRGKVRADAPSNLEESALTRGKEKFY